MEATTLLTPGEAAELLRLTAHKVRQLARAGRIPTVYLPDDELRFDERELWDWVELHKRGIAEDASE